MYSWFSRLQQSLETNDSQKTEEEDNLRDPYFVAVTKSCNGVVGVEVVGVEFVGDVPRYLSTLCSLFIRQSGVVYCIVTGTC